MKMPSWYWRPLYIDIKRMLVLKAKTTTRENGTNEVDFLWEISFFHSDYPDRDNFQFQYPRFQIAERRHL